MTLKYKSEFLNIMEERGFIHQCTNFEDLDKLLTTETVTAYQGIDATAASPHVGNLLPLTMLRWLQKTGHNVLTLVGGGTTKIGDPSGKTELRQMISDDQINANIKGIQKALSNLFDYENSATMVNNDDWLTDLNYVAFLRDYGRHFSINRMLSMDSVKLRLEREQPLSFTEFNYMIFQAYDFLELFRDYNCRLQVGGSDQWGNIVNGVELGRRTVKAELFGLTCPLLTTASGAKMGKSAQGAIWLNADMLSPYDYWQYWRNCEDADVGKMLRLFTELPLDEIARLEALQGAEINDAKKVLADEATKIIHGPEAAAAAHETAQKTFEEGAAGADLPVIEIPREAMSAGVPAFTLFKDAGLAASNGEARRLIKGGGAKVNDEKVSAEDQMITLKDFAANDTMKLSAGKKRHALVKIC
ncbi:MAG: tyrosine--tRNA ligase [Pseudomonadota bacterium]